MISIHALMKLNLLVNPVASLSIPPLPPASQFVFGPGKELTISGTGYCSSDGSPLSNLSFTCKQPIDPEGDGPVWFINATHGWVAGGLISPEVRITENERCVHSPYHHVAHTRTYRTVRTVWYNTRHVF
jgi:hypothetical protein